jgi:hypothetical protein
MGDRVVLLGCHPAIVTDHRSVDRGQGPGVWVLAP